MNDKCTHGWTTPPECLACTLEELESLRQENSQLRERMNQLTDDYEGTIFQLREALKNNIKTDGHNTDCLLGMESSLCSCGKSNLKALNPPKAA